MAIRKDLEEFTVRISALRDAPAMDTALLELANAEEELRVCTEELERMSLLSAENAQREALVHRAFHDLPFPVFVLDGAGMIRALNRHGAGLLGIADSLAVGKPFAVFVELPWRTTFRCELADVLRESRPGSLACRLRSRATHRPPPLELRLTRLGSPPQRDPLVLVTLDPFAERTAAEGAGEAAPLHRLDLMGRMTRLLLNGAAEGGPAMLENAGTLLAAECADFVVIDLVRGGALRRAVVAGTSGGPAGKEESLVVRVLEAIDPEQSEVARTIVRTGESMLHVPLGEKGALGRGQEAAAVADLLSPGFAAAVALRDETSSLGVLLLVRRPDRAAFTLTDLALYEELGLHLGLALKR
ncbi:PAS domain-containing protein [Spirillospora sp. NPDC047279]|uniref:PAS domain-containing protein n=1 Tax=Spirillospora sp. NPDC047279 TaxID=3155478 RepID=UPI0033D20119